MIDPSNWDWDELGQTATANAIEFATSKIKDGADLVISKIAAQWAEMKWPKTADTYRDNLRQNLSQTKILGNPKPIEIEKVYTDVFVHDKPSAFRRFSGDVDTLNKALLEELTKQDRVPAVDAALSGSNLFILGRPGAGKTTLLKYLAILCCKGSVKKTPIFVVLKDWSDSNLSLIAFISRQFDLCGFPDADAFVKALLQSGKALVLLDGLDEVSEAQQKRNEVIKEVVAFSRKYRKCQYCLTCRTAATDYSFDDFNYVEVADFTLEQQLAFVNNWYGSDRKRHEKFRSGWQDANQEGLRELGKTPLLLTLLCLAFDETFNFPLRQVDLYSDALDALLRKWDSSRLIARDEFYRKLSHSRREHMLESIAARFYLDTRVAFQRVELEDAVLSYLKSLPDKEISGRADASTVIRQIEAQHGLIVERASGVYAFSHLTIQEYLTASFLVKNRDERLINQVSSLAIRDPKWREVVLFAVAMSPIADHILESLAKNLAQLRDAEAGINRYLTVALCNAVIAARRQVSIDSGRLESALVFSRYEPTQLKKSILAEIKRQRHPPLSTAELRAVSSHVRSIRESLDKKERRYDFGIAPVVVRSCDALMDERPSEAAELLGGYFARPDNFIGYLYGCRLLIDCLEVAVTRQREKFLAHIMTVDSETVTLLASQAKVPDSRSP